MNQENIRAIELGAMNALRLYLALLTAPYHIAKAFVTLLPSDCILECGGNYTMNGTLKCAGLSTSPSYAERTATPESSRRHLHFRLGTVRSSPRAPSVSYRRLS